MSNPFLLVPIFCPMAGALLSYLVGRKSKPARDVVASLFGIVTFLSAALLFVQAAAGRTFTFAIPYICANGLTFKLDGFRALYAGVAALMWMSTTVFSGEYLEHYRNRNRYYLFTLLTCGATIGVFLSNDFFTTFVFFEIMSFTSYVLVIHDEKPAAMRAGETYIAVAVIGGMVMLMGLFLLQFALGTLNFDQLQAAAGQGANQMLLYTAGVLILFGFGAKAGMFPLHIWLPKAHPVAPAPASALLSGILTKAGIFGVLVLSGRLFFHDSTWGSLILTLGVITMFLGALLAVFSIDLKRTLACSSMSQIGFILVGIGMQGLLGHHNSLAVWGTVLHMVNHSLLKLVLFLCAGAIFMNLHVLDLNKLRGWGRNKPLLHLCFLMGVLGITGVPLWNGYISKTLLHESIVEYIELLEAAGAGTALFHCVEWIFLISGGLTAAYMTKLYICIFWEKPMQPFEEHKKPYMHLHSALCIAIPALLLPLMGMLPTQIMGGMARMAQGFTGGESPEHAIAWFSLTNLKGAAISLGIGAAVYLLIIRPLLMAKDEESGRRVYVNRWPAWLDLEMLVYRPLVQYIIPFVTALVCRILDHLTDWGVALLNHSLLRKRPIPPRNEEDYKPGNFLPRERGDFVSQRIVSSISYSLLLFGVGFCVAMGYMILILLLR